MRVLIVDDDESSRYLSASILRAAGWDIMEAGDGQEALEIARAEPPDVLLSDILMPRMDGYMLAREWKRDLALSCVPVVFLTASYTDDADARLAMDLGAARFLIKPVDPNLLVQVLQEAVEEIATGPGERPPRVADDAIMAEYGERLVRKLEKKVIELQEANRMLRRTMGTLSQELDVKSELIRQLGGQLDASPPGLGSLGQHDTLGRAVDGAAAIVVVVDRTGTITYISPAAERLFGRGSDDAVGEEYFSSFVPEGQRDERRATMAAAFASGAPARSASVVLDAKGEARHVEWLDFPVRDGNGDVAGIVAFGLADT